MKKLYKWVTSILLVILIAITAVLFIPRVFGLKPMAVLSGSMEPAYHVGSLVYIKETSPDKIMEGDPVTFKIGSGTVVTHRVVKADRENQCFTTKGDANDNEDGGTVAYSDVIGKPIFTIPYLGYLAAKANTKSGMILLITFILVILILTFLPDLLTKEEKDGNGGK